MSNVPFPGFDIDHVPFPYEYIPKVAPQSSAVFEELFKALDTTHGLVERLKARRDQIRKQLEEAQLLAAELEYLEFILEREEDFHK